MSTKASFFKPKNKLDEKEFFSPSGRYKLIVAQFSTKKGAWNYTQGSVYSKGSDVPIGIIQRNYSSFPFQWVEDHANGHDYLVGGENYQGQTVIELDTGKRKDFLPKEAKDGFGFCWSSYDFIPEHQILLVNGCYWACPYEYRLYDFSDPMNGWPLLDLEDPEQNYIDSSVKRPTIDSSGIVTAYQTKEELDCIDDYGEETTKNFDADAWIPDEYYEDEKHAIVATKTYKLQNRKLVFVSKWVSEPEKKYRAEQEQARKEYEAWKENFIKTDPLYLAYVNLVKSPELDPEDYMSTGYTHENWCPDQKYDEGRWCRRILKSKNKHKSPYTLDLEWAVKTGPVKLVIYKKGKSTSEAKFWMEHSKESMNKAFEYAINLIKESK